MRRTLISATIAAAAIGLWPTATPVLADTCAGAYAPPLLTRPINCTGTFCQDRTVKNEETGEEVAAVKTCVV